jgi:uncharacterized protein (TIGR03435 family)
MRAKGQLPPPDAEGFLPCQITGRDYRVRAWDHTIQDLVRFLAFKDRLTIEDLTGLSGRFQIDIRYTSPVVIAAGLERPDAAPELEVALREQLGLRLRRRQIEIEVLVVDKVQPPTEN